MTDDLLQQAIRLVQAGKMESARERLEQILKNDRSNILAWHWYAQTWPGAKERVRIWQACLRFNPTSQQAQQALKDLNVDPHKVASQEIKRPTNTFPKKSSGPSPWLLWLIIGILGAVAVVTWVEVNNSVLSAPKDPQQYRHVQTFEYYLYAPEEYSADKEWPLFVGIHGAGGSGLDCWNVWQPYADKEGFILLCPSIPGESYGFRVDVGEMTLWSTVGNVRSEYRTLPRIFFTGFSAGAYFIQVFATDYLGVVSGLSILSSGNYMEPSLFPEVIPMTVVIGDSDDPTAVQTSQLFVDGLMGYGFDVQYKVLPGVGHTVTKEGVDLTIDLFRKTIGK